MTLSDHRFSITVGTRLSLLRTYPNGRSLPEYYRGKWEVVEVLGRGVVVEAINNGGHRHLIEWTEPMGDVQILS